MLDHPALDAAKAARTPPLNTGSASLTTLGGGVGMPILATLVAVGLALAWRQWTPILLIAARPRVADPDGGRQGGGRGNRPALADAVPPYELTASFPSGHTLNSVALAGVLAYLLVRRQPRKRSPDPDHPGGGACSFAIGLSRVDLGHHWSPMSWSPGRWASAGSLS